jgi:hypothetical protein
MITEGQQNMIEGQYEESLYRLTGDVRFRIGASYLYV